MKKFLCRHKKLLSLLMAVVLLSVTAVSAFAATTTPTKKSFSMTMTAQGEQVVSTTRQQMEVGSDPVMAVTDITYSGSGSVPAAAFAVYMMDDPTYGPDLSSDLRITSETLIREKGLHYLTYLNGYGNYTTSEDYYYLCAYATGTVNGTLHIAGEWNV